DPPVQGVPLLFEHVSAQQVPVHRSRRAGILLALFGVVLVVVLVQVEVVAGQAIGLRLGGAVVVGGQVAHDRGLPRPHRPIAGGCCTGRRADASKADTCSRGPGGGWAGRDRAPSGSGARWWDVSRSGVCCPAARSATSRRGLRSTS